MVQVDREKQKLYKLLRQKEELAKYGGHLYKIFPSEGPLSIDNYPRHKELINATQIYNELCFFGGNRTGKSQLGAYLTACHLTGDYPEWFAGRKFDGPIEAWAAGDTAQTTRDVVQRGLVGPPGGIGTGMLARDSILRTTSKSGVPDGLDTVWVKHKSGGTSRLGLKSYDQKRRSFQGTARHWAWLDEECPHDVYEECLMRTMTTNGIILVTFTPIQGLTKFVVDFMDAAEDHST